MYRLCKGYFFSFLKPMLINFYGDLTGTILAHPLDTPSTAGPSVPSKIILLNEYERLDHCKHENL